MGYLFLFPLGRRFLLRPALLFATSFVLTACGGGAESISPEGNTPPLVASETVNMPENTVKNITLSATDVDGDFLVYSILQYPNHGQLSLNGEVASYAPDSNFVGEDQFTFSANDGVVDSLQGIISFIIEDVEYKPVADDVVITLNEDVSNFAITLKGSSTDNKPLIYSIVDQASHASGVVTINDEGKAVYSVDANYVGDDSFTYKVNDGELDSNVARVTITISSENDAPVSLDSNADLQEDRSVRVALIASDAENATLNYYIENEPSHGSVRLEGADAIYTPYENYYGRDRFSFGVNDGFLDSNIADVNLTITAINDAPVAQNGSATVDTGSSVQLTLRADDIDSASLSFSVVRQPQNGHVVIANNRATYTPNNGHTGSDSFTFRAKDGSLFSNVATVGIMVKSVNGTPHVADNHTGAVQEDHSVDILLRATDPDGDPLTYLLGRATHGFVEQIVSNGVTKARYTPNANYNGRDSFSFKVNDGESDSNSVVVSIVVEAINDAPVALDMSLTVTAGVSQSVLLSASDIDGQSLTYEISIKPNHGTVSVVGNVATYSAYENYAGSDFFTFSVSDGQAVASGNITILCQLPKPYVNILPLGDSITQARYDQLSYRYPLWKKLIDAGADFDIIGSQDQTYYGTRTWPAYNGHDFDQDHEGYSGMTADWILNYADFHYDNPADIALIHLGTNDLLWTEDDGETIKNDIANLINKLRETNPNMKILVAKILPFDFNYPGHDVSARYYDFTSRLSGLANDMSQTNSPVSIVDMSYINDSYDGLHPNAVGEEKMAQQWFDAMSAQGVF